jgi:hypothetical protein
MFGPAVSGHCRRRRSICHSGRCVEIKDCSDADLVLFDYLGLVVAVLTHNFELTGVHLMLEIQQQRTRAHKLEYQEKEMAIRH